MFLNLYHIIKHKLEEFTLCQEKLSTQFSYMYYQIFAVVGCAMTN